MLNITAIELIGMVSKQISEIEDSEDGYSEACKDFAHWVFVLSNFHASTAAWKKAFKELEEMSVDLK